MKSLKTTATRRVSGFIAGVALMLFAVSAPARDAEFDVGAFLPYWGMPAYRNYDYTSMDTLYIQASISEASVMSGHGLIFKDPKGPDPYAQPELGEIVRHVRSSNQDIKIVLSIADLHITESDRASSIQLFGEESAGRTIDYLVREYVDRFGFDGVALDIEGESLVRLGAAYGRFVSALSGRLHEQSATRKRKQFYVFLDNSDYRENYVDANVTDSVDFIGIMDYGAEKMDYITANPKRDLKQAAENWASRIDRGKLLLGIAGWGQYVDAEGVFTSDGQSYRKLLEMARGRGVMGEMLTTTPAGLPPLSSETTQRYNSLFEYRRKTEFAFYGGHGGVFFWDIAKDSTDPATSALRSMHEWKKKPGAVPRVLGATDRDFYSGNQKLMGRFHGLPPSKDNWVEIHTYESGVSTGRFLKLPEAGAGDFSFPADVTDSLDPGALYILKFFHRADGAGQELLGTSHPFYRL